MAITVYPLNDIDYTAEDVAIYNSTRTSGIYGGDDFAITLTGADNTISIDVGLAWMRLSRFHGVAVAMRSKTSIDLGIPDATYPRIDALVLQFDANKNGAELVVKKGAPAGNPLPPALSQTEALYELHLVHVLREPGAASIAAAAVTDLRLDEAYCGLMADAVTKVDTAAISSQVTALIQKLKADLAAVEKQDYYASKEYADTRNPYNYIHNADFSRFVAQVGIGGKHGNQAYAGDRWILDSGTVTGKTNADGEGYSNITLNGTIRQIVANAPAVATPGIEMISGTATITYANGAVTVTSSGGVIGFVKLFEGEYTADNMPNGKPKGYGAELAECRRYFINLFTERSYEYFHIGQAYSTTEAIINIPLATAMRINPSVTYSGITLSNATMGLKTVTDITVQRASEMGTMLYVVASGLAAGNATLLSKKDTTGYAHLSADL